MKKYLNEDSLILYTEMMKKIFIDRVQNEYTNCPNCGAPITGFKCEYCGTKFNVNVSNLRNITINYSK